MPEDLETRTVLTPRTGTKICILIGLALIATGIYFYFVPVTDVHTTTGSVFGCGTAASPADSSFARGICGQATDVEKYRAILAAVVGVLTVVLGALMFGVDRRTETRTARYVETGADDRSWDEPRGRRGGEGRSRDRDEDRRDDRRGDRDEERRSAGRDDAPRDEAPDDRATPSRKPERPARDWDRDAD